MEKTKGHILFLDHLRGIAIMVVFLCHASRPILVLSGHSDWVHANGISDYSLLKNPISLTTTLMLQGWLGVSIFFVISGFCIHLSHQRSRLKSWKEFLIRRFFRIYPPYVFALFIFAFLLPYSRMHLGTSEHDFRMTITAARDLLSHLFLVHHFEVGPNDVNPPFWSIAVEVKLYILYPLLVWLAFHLGWRGAIWCTGIIELGLRTAQVLQGLHLVTAGSWYLQAPVYFWFSWSIGAWLAEAYMEDKPLPFRKIPLFAFPLLFVLCDLIPPLFPFCFPLASLSTAQVIARLLGAKAAASPAPSIWPFLSEHIRKTGIVSYSLYLIHYPIQDTLYLFVRRFLPGLFSGTSLTMLGLFCLLLPFWFIIFHLSRLLHHYVEIPSIAWGSRLIQQGRDGAGTHVRMLPHDPIGDKAAP